MTNVILFGDSIRMGYQPLVAEKLGSGYEVWAPVENGGTSRNTQGRLEAWLEGRTPQIIHINCGLHDIAVSKPGMPRRVLLPDYEENLRQIFARLKQAAPRVIWATSTPVFDEHHWRVKNFERHEEDVQTYNSAAAPIAREMGLEINDLHDVVVQAGVEKCLQADGVHMTPFGYNLLAEAVAGIIRKVP